MAKEQREFRTDPLKLKRLRLQLGLTIEAFCKETGIDKATARKLFGGVPVSMTTLVAAAEGFGITNHLEMLHPDELAAVGIDPDAAPSPNQVLEWEIESPRLSGWLRTANGLQYQLARAHHRIFADRFARVKCYELRHIPVKDRKPLDQHLRRHADVCSKIGRHPNIAENITATTTEHGGLWWVIDRWDEGQSLETHLKEGALESARLKSLMLGIAEGLHALHEKGIIRRELSPRSILVRQSDGSPVLTDFELAKLTLGKPTVKPKGSWPEDPYLALEVTGAGGEDERADVYSWASRRPDRRSIQICKRSTPWPP